MIPQFPQFKKLELEDKPQVESITHRFAPYSDFNFVSMWSWNVKDEMAISDIYGNLAVRFNDYITGLPFYSFLGEKNVTDTAKKLVHFSKAEGLPGMLRLVPETSALLMDKDGFDFIEERDQFDYIYDLPRLSKYQESDYKTQRNFVASFRRKFPNVAVSEIDLKDSAVQEQIHNLDVLWMQQKQVKIEKEEAIGFDKEYSALHRLFSIYQELDLCSVGAYDGNRLIAFAINELLPGGYALSHFAKIDKTYSGLYSFLMQQDALVLMKKGKGKFNYEQDLGIQTLRYTKESFNPSAYLKKFMITCKDV